MPSRPVAKRSKPDAKPSASPAKPSEGSAKPSRHLALLRGVNVGGKNKLPMRDLTTLFEGAGASEVVTYIQSGNVVFVAADPAAVARAVERAIAERFGFEVPLVVRTAAELAATVRFALGAPPLAQSLESLHVMFLREEPQAAQVSTLEPMRSPPDTFLVQGREIFLVLPNGAARTRLTNAYFDAKLRTVSTGRNWRTVLALHELATA